MLVSLVKKKFFIYYLAGYLASGKNIGRISGQISIRYIPKLIVISSVQFFYFTNFRTFEVPWIYVQNCMSLFGPEIEMPGIG